jgi:hypothetical protein
MALPSHESPSLASVELPSTSLAIGSTHAREPVVRAEPGRYGDRRTASTPACMRWADLRPGRYRTEGADGCYSAKLGSSDKSDIVDNFFGDGP